MGGDGWEGWEAMDGEGDGKERTPRSKICAIRGAYRLPGGKALRPRLGEKGCLRKRLRPRLGGRKWPG